MSVIPSDLFFYGCENHQEVDTGTQGGAISTSKKLVFVDLTSTGNIQIISSSSSDTESITVTGRNPSGVLISETKNLDGTNSVAMTTHTSWERLLKATKGGTTTGTVAVEFASPVRTGNPQSAANSTPSLMAYIQLDSEASSTNDIYAGHVLRISSGTGAGQIRSIVSYDGSTKRAYVNQDFTTLPDTTSIFRISVGMVFEKSPSEITEIRRPFYNAVADPLGGSSRDYYEKVFIKNNHATLALTSGTISEFSDPSGKVTFALANNLDDTGTSTNRLTAPSSGITAFSSDAKNIANSQNLTPGAAQGIWLKLSLVAGDSAQKTTYTLQAQGVST